MSGFMHTKWSAAQQYTPPLTDEEKHARFAGFAQVATNSYAPWLLPLLDEARATVYVDVGKFLFILPSDPGHWHEIPELSALLTAVPWTEEGDEEAVSKEVHHGTA